MGTLIDFFVASPADLSPQTLKHSPISAFPTIQMKNWATIQMALLLQVLEHRPLDKAVDRLDEFPLVLTCAEAGPWVCACPETLRDALAALPEEALALYASRWGESDELGNNDLSVLVSLLRDLTNLCRQARSEQKALYLWLAV